MNFHFKKKEKKTPPVKNTQRDSKLIRIVIVVATILICATFLILNYTSNIFKTKYKMISIGYFWTAPTLKADYNFSIYKPSIQYRAELQNARDSVNPIFISDVSAWNSLNDKIKKIVNDLLSMNDVPIKQHTTQTNLDNFFRQTEAIQYQEISKISNQLIPFVKKIYDKGYIDQSLSRFRMNDIISVRLLPNTQYNIIKEVVYDKEKFSIELQQFCSHCFNDETSPLVVDLIYKISQPNLVLSEKLTNRSATIAEMSVRKTLGIIHKGEVIVKRGERLTEDKINIIRSYNEENIVKENSDFSFLKILGSLGHSAMDFSILLSFLIIIRKRIWADNFQVLLLSIPIILVSFLGFLSFQIQGDNQNIPLEYLVMIPAFSTFIAIVFDSRTAFYTTVSMAFTLAAVRGNDYFFGLTMLFTGTIAAYCVKDIQDRTQMFSSIIYIFIGFAIAIFVVGFERGYSFAIMMPQLFLALINSILAPVITLLLLMLVNKIDGYNIVTNLTLREYLQKEHPLIKQLKEKANGTFEHSREVAQMAELAASAIDANALLVKVGAYFHDIGKMNNPDFFTENYEKADDFENPHTSLTPKQSAEKIIQHICDGIKMAKEAKLPQVILDFIPEHHGTTLVKHFYNVALNNAKETGETVDKNDFRYPGPKPQSKETAILMLCDSAQAVSKSVTDIKQFTNIFESIIEERIKFEQFAECNLTLQDIATIKEVIYKEIKGKIHTRTQYAVANEPEKKEEA